MEEKKINISVLVAPLDWGLGHATRCIAIIDFLLQKRCRVIIAAHGSHKILLEQIFPQLEFLHLDGYNIEYAKKNVLYKLAKQLPNVLKTINKEHVWLANAIEEHQIDFVISDNRYGLWSKKIPSVFVTHQLQLEMPNFFKWAGKSIQKKLYGLIEHFSICWVPDVAEAMESLSGKLGHPDVMPNIEVKYIGALSRFLQKEPEQKKYKVMVCLSGPEPQRSLLESIILPQLKQVQGEVLLVRGKPGSNEILSAEKNIIIKNHLPTNEMQQAFQQSEYIISRCGYTTLMDMQVLQCKCVYIPTPGQTEQEYLGKRLSKSNKAIVCGQQDFNVVNALKQAAGFNFKIDCFQQGAGLENAIDELLKAYMFSKNLIPM